MRKDKLLWVDDEISMLRPHIMFLEGKGYEVDTVTNGQDALDCCRTTTYDLILLDENMPGLSGLQTLSMIKDICPTVPVVMVTKSEEENIMDMAIGQKIADYLIKPVNPNQILLSLKKNLHRKDIVSEVTQTTYQQDFGRIGMQINDRLSATEWIELYKKLVYWELELESSDSPMGEMLAMQKNEANAAFARFVKHEYMDWMAAMDPKAPQQARDARPLMSPDIFKHFLLPLLDRGEKVFFIVLDNFRYDQWRVLAAEIAGLFNVEEQLYYSILPTTTQYARNALFSGLMPDQIVRLFPDLWIDEDEEESKNLNEAPLIQTLFDRYRRQHTFSYHKINDAAAAEKTAGNAVCGRRLVLYAVLRGADRGGKPHGVSVGALAGSGGQGPGAGRRGVSGAFKGRGGAPEGADVCVHGVGDLRALSRGRHDAAFAARVYARKPRRLRGFGRRLRHPAGAA